MTVRALIVLEVLGDTNEEIQRNLHETLNSIGEHAPAAKAGKLKAHAAIKESADKIMEVFEDE